METVTEIKTEQTEERIEEQISEQQNIIVTAKCAICEKEIKINNETIKWLSEITFKRNPEARGARLQDALNFTEGNNCIENGTHAFIFDDKWFAESNDIAMTIKTKNESLSSLIDTSHNLKEQIEQLTVKLQKTEHEKQSITEEIPQLKENFVELTGTDNYKAWL